MSLDQANDAHLMWKIAGGLIVIVVLAGAYLWMNTQDTVPATVPSETPVTMTSSSQATASPTVQVENNQVGSATNTQNIEDKTLVNESILQDKVPEHAALAKEEIAKLDDIQKQLLEQQHNLAAQQADADQLIQLKEEQIKLLEQQLSAQN